jgi:hypothetical protein
MSDVSSLQGGPLSPVHAVGPIAAASLPAGTPVYLNGSGQAAAAKADSSGAVAGSPCVVQIGSGLSLTDAQWEAVVNGAPVGGLTPGGTYYLSPLTAGLLTTTKPSGDGQFLVVVGYALSATSLLLKVGQPVLVGSG